MNTTTVPLLLFFTILFFSCSEPNVVGLDVYPNSDQITTQNLTFENFSSNSVSVDSLRSDNSRYVLPGRTTPLLLGSINDQEFGTSDAYFKTQILLSENNISLGSAPVVDSAIITYSYIGLYGDINAGFTNVSVTRSLNELNENDKYYSNSFELDFNYENWVNDYTISENNFTIYLNNDSAQKILNFSDDDLSDNSAFLSVFNGFNIIAKSSNMILYLNPSSVNTNMKIYYHNATEDSLVLNFSLGGDAVRVNLFENSKEPMSSENTYIQSMNGYNTHIVISDLDSLRFILEGKSINKAVLLLNVKDNSQDQYKKAHDKVLLYSVDDHGNYNEIIDLEYNDVNSGLILSDEDRYECNITRHFTNLIQGTNNVSRFCLTPLDPTLNANRTILNKDIRLMIYFSDLTPL